jgi:hypothetical protein
VGQGGRNACPRPRLCAENDLSAPVHGCRQRPSLSMRLQRRERTNLANASSQSSKKKWSCLARQARATVAAFARSDF